MGAFPSGSSADEFVFACNTYGNNVFGRGSVFGIITRYSCPGDAIYANGLTVTTEGDKVSAGKRAYWQALAPSGLVIVAAEIPPGQLSSEGVNDGRQYGGGFYWAGGGAETYDGETTASFSNLASRYFGWQVICGHSPCLTDYNWITVSEIRLDVRETVGPSLDAPAGLWQASGWVRGDWPLALYGDSPSGICNLSALISGQTVAVAGSLPSPSVWHQCSSPAIDQTVHTWQYGQGGLPLTLRASDAAGITTSDASYTKTIYVDNSQPTVTLSGPSDAPSTAGVQYVTASAGGSPSGIDGIACSTDDGTGQWYPGTTAKVPVSGIGQHVVKCAAADNAVDGAGNHGWSSWQSWSLTIRQPTVLSTSFARLADALRCHRISERVLVPGSWVTVVTHGQALKIHRPAYFQRVRFTRCAARLVRRRVRVHGRWRILRVPVFPHVVSQTVERIGFGQPATVSGWLGLSSGTALGGQSVRILSAPDDGTGNFRQVASAATDADGVWTAALPPGPSRIVVAVYDGSGTAEPTSSADARLIVPAKVRLSVEPQALPWGARVVISGRLLGGYIPANKTVVSQLLRLRIGTAGIFGTVGIPDVDRRGRFHTIYCFNPGQGVVRFWFSVSTLNETDYPYSPGASRRITVVVGPGNAPPPQRCSG